MANRELQSIKLRLEYAVTAQDEMGLEVAPYETALELPVVNEIFFPDDNVPGEAILGMRLDPDGFYALYRLKNKVESDSDADDELESLQGALKVSFVSAKPGIGEPIVDVAYYPFRPEHDSLVENFTGLELFLILKREDLGTGPVYRLIYKPYPLTSDWPTCEQRCNAIKHPNRRRHCLLRCRRM